MRSISPDWEVELARWLKPFLEQLGPSLAEVGRTLFRTYRQRTMVGITLMAAQAFFYNAIFFTYALVLTDFYAVPADRVGSGFLKESGRRVVSERGIA